MIQQKPEFVTRQIRKIAREIGSLADNIDNHHERGKFYAELLKNKIFELYESNNLLMDLLNEKSVSFPESSKSVSINTDIKQEKNPAQETEKPAQVLIKEETITETREEAAFSENESSHKESVVESQVENTNEETPIPEDLKVDTPIPEEIKEVDPPSKNEILKEVETEIPELIVKAEVSPNEFQTTVKKEDTWLYNNLITALEKTRKSGDIAEKKQDQPIKSLGNSISISQKHEFISALFAGESNALKDAISKIESMNSFDDAIVWLDQELSNQNNWKKNEKLSFEFANLVRRRFLQPNV
jgi:hypothetical protein